MLPKEDREIIAKIGRYKYHKMKDMNLTYKEFLDYEKNKEKEKKLKQKIGYKNFNKMKELGLNYQEYKQYNREQKCKKYERKREKDRIRFRTIRYVERYCDLEMKCQICESKENVEIHHPNYNDYLKINLLCKKHHTKLHNFELVPPSIINLESIAIKKPPIKEKQKYISTQLMNIRQDILNSNYSYRDIEEKYKIDSTTMRAHLSKEQDYDELKMKLKENGRRKQIIKGNFDSNNLVKQYQIKYNLSAKEISEITEIPLPTIRKILSGQTSIEKIKPKTKTKLQKLKEAI